MNPTIDLLTSHRSIRKFTSESVPQGLLETLIAAGQGASTSNHVQACSVIRVSDTANRDAVMALAGNQPYISAAPEFLVFCADMKRNVDAAERTGIEATRGMTEQLLVSTIDVALFAQNVAVAAESVGLGIVYIGGIRNNPAQISEILKLPEHVYPVFGMCIGYPDQQPEIKPRLPLATVLKQDYYNGDNDAAIVEQYDQDMSDYYQHRSGAAKDSNWSKGMAPMFSGKLRPHMREFLISKGFELK